MPGGSATYNGRFVATAKTENYLKPTGADIDPNALWRVQGASQVTANFGTAGVTGTLTPETWTSFQKGIGEPLHENRGMSGHGPRRPYTVIETPNYSFYNTTVALSGTITGNTYAGDSGSTLTGPFISGDQTMYGGFFGATAPKQPASSMSPAWTPIPVGGSAGINDDTRGYLTIQGAFNGTTPKRHARLCRGT